jgi:hypothetical protein
MLPLDCLDYKTPPAARKFPEFLNPDSLTVAACEGRAQHWRLGRDSRERISEKAILQNEANFGVSDLNSKDWQARKQARLGDERS